MPKRGISANLTHAQSGMRVPDMNDKTELTMGAALLR